MRDKAKVRRAIVTAAINECQQLLVPYKATRPWDYDAVWRIISQMAVDQDTNSVRRYVFGDIDIYQFCWKLDYYAFECTTSYMDIALKLRRALNAHWLSETRHKIHKEVRDGEARRRTPHAGRTKGKRAKAHKQKRQR